MGDDVDVIIESGHSLEPQAIFREIHGLGVSDQEMYKTFNCGIGFVVGVQAQSLDRIGLRKGLTEIIGRVERGRGGIAIQSAYSNKEIEL